jgi:replicative DNA helicase
MDTESPSSPEAEAAALCCIIENPARFAPLAWESQLSAELFHDAAHAALWTIASGLVRDGKPSDPASLRVAIRSEKPAGLTLSKFSAILLTEFSPDSWHGYVETLRDCYARRISFEAGQSVVSQNLDGQAAVAALRKAAETAAGAMAGTSAVLNSEKAVTAFLRSLNDRYEKGDSPGLPTGIEVIDQHTGGLRDGELWVVGAKTSGGKSIFMLQVAIEALREKKRVAIFSLEMAASEVVGRMISCGWHLNIGEIMNPRGLTNGAISKIQAAAEELRQSELMVCDVADLSMESISGHCQRLADSAPLDLVVIDYIQLVTAPRIKGQNREQEVAGISRACKQLAKRLRCPVMTATQLNENGKSRESRAIEHDADVVWLIDPPNDTGISAFNAWKCRNGERGKQFQAKMDGAKQRFTFI